jgi:predicted short-subunit dehydrogenase-like oxidoreductase (DUF2520 family)
MEKPAIAIVGAGKVGSALAILLQKKGYPIAGVASRSIVSAERLAPVLNCPKDEEPHELTRRAGLVFITTPDREIGRTAKAIADKGGFRPGQVVAHTSGAHSAQELQGAKEAGALVVSLHPLQSFADVQDARDHLSGSYFALEGDEDALPLARRVVHDLGGKAFVIGAKDKPLYHAAACVASNYLVTLIHYATGLCRHFGLSYEEGFRALFPLVQGTISNIGRVGPPRSLTGPIARGDATTIQDHLVALKQVDKRELDLYRMLGMHAVRLAMENGSIDRDQAAEIIKILGEGTPFFT